ncbi:MAG: RNA polymerase sigma factor [Oscillospiraceae bacterium]|nr:RNA polymerase sigma factor [Oscillospiraceae bacterium]
MDDGKLVDLFWRRDEAAINQTQAKYGKLLLRLAQRITGNMEDALECVNDTYLASWNAIPPERPQYFFAYLSKICRNLAFGVLDRREAEKRSATVVELTQELQQCLPDRMAEARLEGREIGDALNRFLGALKTEERRIFLRRYWYGDSVVEIASHFSATQSKVKTQLHRTREKLRKFLEQEGIGI